jgi:2-phospho-L-lactate guanylyltransferase
MIDEIFVVPIKDFDVAKERLRRGGVTGVDVLARTLAAGVIQHCGPRPVIVLSESSEVSSFARELGAEVLESTATGLNEAVQFAYEELGHSYRRLIVVHSDLQHPEGLSEFAPLEGVTVVTDHVGEGTNVLVVPTGVGFMFRYGPHSAQLHEAEATRLGLTCRLVTDSPWRFDVDEPSDLFD